MQKYGLLPRKMLTYSTERANTFYIEEAFVADYFSPTAITSEMYSIAKQCQKYINIAYQQIGKDWVTPNKEVLRGAIQFAPICIGIPIPTDVYNWNQEYIQYDGNKILAHEVELHDISNDGTRFVSDQYNISEKRLSPDYPIYVAYQGIVYSLSKPKPVIPVPVLTPEQSYWQKFWSAISHFWNKIPDSFEIG